MGNFLRFFFVSFLFDASLQYLLWHGWNCEWGRIMLNGRYSNHCRMKDGCPLSLLKNINLNFLQSAFTVMKINLLILETYFILPFYCRVKTYYGDTLWSSSMGYPPTSLYCKRRQDKFLCVFWLDLWHFISCINIM